MRLKSGNDGCCVNYWVPFILLGQYVDFKARKKISSFLFFLLLAIFFFIIHLFSKYNLIFTLYFKICIRFYYWFCHSIFFFLNKCFILFIYFYFTILYWFCHTSTWIHHGCTRVSNPEPPSHLPSHTIPLGHPSAQAPSFLYPTSNLDWWFLSYMILYMFQCHSPKSSPLISKYKLVLSQFTEDKDMINYDYDS